jgi:uncharacterized YccA/Bax inhibitor family protein
MSSRNPVFSKIDAPVVSAEELAQIVNGPKVDGRLTVTDVIMKTAAVFAILVAGAYIGWTTAPTNSSLFLISMITALVLGLVNAFKKQVSPALVLAYGAAEGVFLGTLSFWINETYGENIAQQAVIGTLVAFGVMLAMYKSQVIKVTGRFMKMFSIAMVSYFVIALMSFVASLFGAGDGWGFYGMGQLGILLCVAGVGLATFSLVMDFEMITQAVAAGMPERESWRMAFGLTVTLVWLYTELLRLLAILNGRD